MPPTIPSGCFPAERWAVLLNLPLDAVRAGAVVAPLGYGQSIEFRACDSWGAPLDWTGDGTSW